MLRQNTLKILRVNSSIRNISYTSSSPSQNLTSSRQSEFHNLKTTGIIGSNEYFRSKFHSPVIGGYQSWRNYSARKPSNNNNNPASAGSNDDNHLYEDDDFDVYSSDDDNDEKKEAVNKWGVPSTTTVPDHFPRVPIIVTHYPVFPKFMKVFEVSDPKLIKLLEYKLSIGQPYAGVFVRKAQAGDPSNATNVSTIKDLTECYPVGTFIKITEMNKSGDKLQFIATAHRRIEIQQQIKHERVANPSLDKKVRKQLQEIQSSLRNPESNVLMVEVNNVEEDQPDLNSNEYKAITMEIVKTIRDIIMTNTLIRENLQQILGNNLRVNENPAYLADLAVSITSSKIEELQEIIEEKSVLSRMKMALNLLIKEKQVLELQQKIGKDVETKIKETHRTFMLREQLKAIKRELGLEKDDKDALAEKYGKMLEGKIVPQAVQTVIDEELQKINILENTSSEFT